MNLINFRKNLRIFVKKKNILELKDFKDFFGEFQEKPLVTFLKELLEEFSRRGPGEIPKKNFWTKF